MSSLTEVAANARIPATVRAVLSARQDLDWAYLFGSAARGEHFRDVDVAVMPNEAMAAGAVAFGSLIAAIEQATASTVDLIDLRSASLPLLGALLPDRIVVLDRDPDRRRTWEADATSRWLDFRPAFERANRIREMALRQRLGRS